MISLYGFSNGPEKLIRLLPSSVRYAWTSAMPFWKVIHLLSRPVQEQQRSGDYVHSQNVVRYLTSAAENQTNRLAGELFSFSAIAFTVTYCYKDYCNSTMKEEGTSSSEDHLGTTTDFLYKGGSKGPKLSCFISLVILLLSSSPSHTLIQSSILISLLHTGVKQVWGRWYHDLI